MATLSYVERAVPRLEDVDAQVVPEAGAGVYAADLRTQLPHAQHDAPEVDGHAAVDDDSKFRSVARLQVIGASANYF